MSRCSGDRCRTPEVAKPTRTPKETAKPLPKTTQQELQPTFGCDLSHVRVHDGAKGDQVASQHNARAVALGGQVYFGRGEYQPKTSEGKQVVAHEVTHALQQKSPGATTSSTAVLESQASSAASGRLDSPILAAQPSVPLFLRRGETPTGRPSQTVSRGIRRQLQRDPTDEQQGARTQLGAISPRIRSEVATDLRPSSTPDQQVTLGLDPGAVQAPPISRTGLANQEPASPAEPTATTDSAGVSAAPSGAGAPGAQTEPPAPVTGAPAARTLPAPGTASPGSAPAAATAGPIAATPAGSMVSGPTEAPGIATSVTGGAVDAGPVAGDANLGGGAGPAAPTPAQALTPPPEAPSAPTPDQNPAFQGVSGRVSSVASSERSHTPAGAVAESAQNAAQSPANERQGLAEANQAEAMAAQETNPFDRNAFKAALLARIQEVTPRNLEEADSFREDGRTGEVSRDVAGQVESGTSAAAGGVPAATAATPDTSSVPARTPEQMQSDPVGNAPAQIQAQGAAPAPRPDSQVNLNNGPEQIDSTMSQNGVSTEQLQNSNEPEFQAGVAATDQARDHSQSAPEQFRAEETASLSAEQQQAGTNVGAGVGSMHGSRSSGLGQSTDRQNDARTRTEQERIRITGEINQRFATIRTNVEGRLARVTTEANAEFDTGSATANTNFENYVSQRMNAYKDDRYGGVLGWTDWLADKAFGMPDEVNAFYTEGRDAYLLEMDGVIDRVAVIVETGLTEATTMIQEGKNEIHTFVESLPESLQSIGAEAESSLADQFSQLEQSIVDQRSQLIDSLAQRYVANVQAIDSRITAMQAENRGLVDAALGAIMGIINTIRGLIAMLTNTLARAASAIGLIIEDPIGFLGNLVSAIGLGLRQFLANIGQHLLSGLMGWLFGSLASAGIQMPTTFDLRSILGLVLQILGLTYANFRQRAVRILGEGVVSALETTAEVFRVIITEGPAGLWRWIQEQFEVLKEQVISQIRDFIMERVIMAGIQWVIGLLNPASAFIRACMAIKDIVMFFIERGSQIMELVNAIIDSVTAIAQGNLTAAANWVENALARSIPVLISFLASLLGLGGISDRIRSIIERIQAPINRIIDSVINGCAGLVRSIGRAMGFGRQPENQSPSETVKGLATARLGERLSSDHDLSEIRTITGSVLAELRPQGLLSLEVGPQDEDGNHSILASASAKTSVGKIKRPRDDQGRSIAMEMRGTINLAGPQTTTPAAQIEKDVLYPGPRGESHRALNDRSVLGTVQTSATPNTLLTRTWNGSATHRLSDNQSHAEHHFVSWLNTQDDVKNNMTRLQVVLDPFSPCRTCARELSTVVRDRKRAFPAFTASIVWTTVWVSPDDDRQTAVALSHLSDQFDSVTGPEAITRQEGQEIFEFERGEGRSTTL